ncbi:MAG TPA: trypsin-like peptidase domain-containing protein, partial [Urbifossiella sp.]|nr:trypsin-like peptidase domain-containing protein [Urbifossiella sp.]
MRVLLAALVGALPVLAQPGPRDLLDAYEKQLKALHETAGPAVGCVVVSRSDKYPAPAKLPDYPGRLGDFDADAFRKGGPDRIALARKLDLADPRGVTDHDSATGVVIDTAGLVLTNFHTVEGATKVYVHFPGGKGSYADIHAADARSDFAVLKLLTPPAGLKAVKIGDARLHELPSGLPNVFPGKLVAVFDSRTAAGAVAGRPTLTIPVVGDVKFPSWNPLLQEPPPQSVYRYGPLLELEARAVPAVSGAAVLNLDGELIAMTSATATVGGGEGGRTYAVPLDQCNRRIVEVLARGEEVEYGLLGVVADRIERGGVMVDKVSPRSPADGRLFPGDIIRKINGQPTRNFPDLLYQVGSSLAGSRVTLTVRSDGKDRPVEVTLAKYGHSSPVIYANRPAAVFGLRVDWASVSAQGGIGPQVISPGVVVRELVPDS